MIVGGWEGAPIRRRFADLAGGADADVVCVPTALPAARLTGWCRQFFRTAGIPRRNRTVLHTRKPEKADRESFVEPLRTADAVWFTGGRQWRLVEAYAGTRTLEAFHDVLARGGIIGGTSAGASIQGSFLVRGDPKSKRIVVGTYTDGFGFLPRSAIDQHIRARDRETDLVPVIEERPHLLGVGVDENTAALVRGDTLRVIGEGIVTIYDARRWQAADPPLPDAEKPLVLRPGDRFNLRTRTVLSAPEPADE
jgi:cyanophycinase